MNKPKNPSQQSPCHYGTAKLIEYGLPLLLLIPIYMYLRAIG